MKLKAHTTDEQKFRSQLRKFKKLLDRKMWLDEGKDILPFFRKNRHFTAKVAAISADMMPVDRLSEEAPVWHECRSDFIAASTVTNHMRLIELESAKKNSLFSGKKDSRNWGTGVERGYSQLLDWFYSFDQRRNEVSTEFNFNVNGYSGLLIVGRSNNISLKERRRIDWRNEKVRVNSKEILIMTYDDVYQHFNGRLALSKISFASSPKKGKLR
jgi:hypothetical protein